MRENLCSIQGNSSKKNMQFIIKRGFKSRAGYNGACTIVIYNLRSNILPKGPFKYYVSKEVAGWGQKMAIFSDLQYILFMLI